VGWIIKSFVYVLFLSSISPCLNLNFNALHPEFFLFFTLPLGRLNDLLGGLNEKPCIFQQDNDPKHTWRLMKEYFMENNINVLEWPAQSPDLNPIEHIWSWMKQQLSQIGIKDKADLKNKLMALWK
jgi:DDE superfamily endonuclease